MFSINFTVFLQLFHFGVAYLIIRRFLFIPTFKAIKEEDLNTKIVLASIDTGAESIQKIREAIHREWYVCRLYNQSHAPEPIVQSLGVAHMPRRSFDYIQDGRQEYQAEAQRIAEALIKRVKHVR